eukprot:TRINITY_DN2776_c0_g1_i1.p1 TRINITY_DN2776_c0_g1~~TRINITY_DN2776_c0_g1_i1.p1  ORF type:complete len:223 (+),score=37.00 TRINITY_DN2776_c0_g1_i1:295-963(+)
MIDIYRVIVAPGYWCGAVITIQSLCFVSGNVMIVRLWQVWFDYWLSMERARYNIKSGFFTPGWFTSHTKYRTTNFMGSCVGNSLGVVVPTIIIFNHLTHSNDFASYGHLAGCHSVMVSDIIFKVFAGGLILLAIITSLIFHRIAENYSISREFLIVGISAFYGTAVLNFMLDVEDDAQAPLHIILAWIGAQGIIFGVVDFPLYLSYKAEKVQEERKRHFRQQ